VNIQKDDCKKYFGGQFVASFHDVYNAAYAVFDMYVQEKINA
jgi:hypothetical protein